MQFECGGVCAAYEDGGRFDHKWVEVAVSEVRMSEVDAVEGELNWKHIRLRVGWN